MQIFYPQTKEEYIFIEKQVLIKNQKEKSVDDVSQSN